MVENKNKTILLKTLPKWTKIYFKLQRVGNGSRFGEVYLLKGWDYLNSCGNLSPMLPLTGNLFGINWCPITGEAPARWGGGRGGGHKSSPGIRHLSKWVLVDR